MPYIDGRRVYKRKLETTLVELREEEKVNFVYFELYGREASTMPQNLEIYKPKLTDGFLSFQKRRYDQHGYVLVEEEGKLAGLI